MWFLLTLAILELPVIGIILFCILVVVFGWSVYWRVAELIVFAAKVMAVICICVPSSVTIFICFSSILYHAFSGDKLRTDCLRCRDGG